MGGHAPIGVSSQEQDVVVHLPSEADHRIVEAELRSDRQGPEEGEDGSNQLI